MTTQGVVVKTEKGAQGIAQVVLRACRGCGAANPRGEPNCPKCNHPSLIEELGLVSFYHPRWWERVKFRIGRFIGRRFEWRSRQT